MKKRIISIVLLLVAILSMLAGCNNNKNNDKNDGKGNGNKQETEYSVSLDTTSVDLYLGESTVIHATVLPAGAELKWTSSNTSVATVNGGIVTAVGEGVSMIKAVLPDGTGASCKVEVLGERLVVGSEIGNKCPTYSLDLVDGSGKVNINDYAGKVVIINFWGTWCGPCKTELPDFDRIASEYIDGVVVLAIHSVAGKSNAPTYISTNFSDSDMVFAYDTPLTGQVDMYYNLLGGKGSYPRTMILDERGVITFAQEGMMSYEQLKQRVDGLLGE